MTKKITTILIIGIIVFTCSFWNGLNQCQKAGIIKSLSKYVREIKGYFNVPIALSGDTVTANCASTGSCSCKAGTECVSNQDCVNTTNCSYSCPSRAHATLSGNTCSAGETGCICE